MKRTMKLHNILRRKVVCHHMLKYCRDRLSMIMLVVFTVGLIGTILSLGSTMSSDNVNSNTTIIADYNAAGEPNWSVGDYNTLDIAEGLLAAEARLADLRLEYVAKVRVHTKDKTNPIRVTDAVYAQKMITDQNTPKRLRYLERKVSMMDPNTEESSLIEDMWASFDGKVTMMLDRRPGSGRHMRGSVYARYDPNQFPRIDNDPHTSIWYFPNKLLGDTIKENVGTFRIESQGGLVGGVPTVKLVGTIWDGVVTLRLWVSPERNFLPLKMHVVRTRDGRLAAETVLSNLVQLPNRMWYPRTIRFGAPDPKWAYAYEISKISVEPISMEFFTPKFPPNTHVYDHNQGVSYTTY